MIGSDGEGRNKWIESHRRLLTEFSGENQFEKVLEETRFEHFAAYLATSRHVADTFDTADLATGAGGDTGIDAIAILINGSLVTDSELVAELAKTNGVSGRDLRCLSRFRCVTHDSPRINPKGRLSRSRPHCPYCLWPRPRSLSRSRHNRSPDLGAQPASPRRSMTSALSPPPWAGQRFKPILRRCSRLLACLA